MFFQLDTEEKGTISVANVIDNAGTLFGRPIDREDALTMIKETREPHHPGQELDENHAGHRVDREQFEAWWSRYYCATSLPWSTCLLVSVGTDSNLTTVLFDGLVLAVMRLSRRS